jgi:hypothetical protein
MGVVIMMLIFLSISLCHTCVVFIILSVAALGLVPDVRFQHFQMSFCELTVKFRLLFSMCVIILCKAVKLSFLN